MEHQVRDLKALLDVSNAISSDAHLDDLLQVIMDKNSGVIDAKSRGELRSKIVQKLGKIMEIHFPVDVRIAGSGAKTQKGVNIKDAYNYLRFDPVII